MTQPKSDLEVRLAKALGCAIETLASIGGIGKPISTKVKYTTGAYEQHAIATIYEIERIMKGETRS